MGDGIKSGLKKVGKAKSTFRARVRRNRNGAIHYRFLNKLIRPRVEDWIDRFLPDFEVSENCEKNGFVERTGAVLV